MTLPRAEHGDVRRPLIASLVVVAMLGVTPARAATAPRIALIDSGIASNHAEFRPGQVVAWKDFVNGQPSPYDDLGHGTAVASRAAGKTIGAYPAANLIVAKVLNASNSTSWAMVTDALTWVTDQHPDVISVSIWSPIPATGALALAQAIHRAVASGITVVWIAGNGGDDDLNDGDLPLPSTVLPGASSAEVIVVGASTASGAPADFSQPDPELLAAGVGVPIAWRNGGYATGSGTSYAAPWVAGAIARLLAEGAPRDPDWIEWVVEHVSKDDPDVSYLDEGYGVFGPTQLAAAVAVARGDAAPPAPDGRDAFHLATSGVRTAESGAAPTGILPPS